MDTEKLLNRIDTLEKRVAELESKTSLIAGPMFGKRATKFDGDIYFDLPEKENVD